MTGERTLPGIGLTGYWDLGSEYKDEMDANLRLLSAACQLAVDSSVSSLPGSPSDGDMHRMTSGGNDTDIAIRDDGSWVYIAPAEGWFCYDKDADVLLRFDGSAWTDYLDGTAIKAAYEAESDTNAFTDSEKAKLAGLSDSPYLGTYASEAALTSAHATAAAGSYAHVDAGIGNDVALWIWDDDDDDWVQAGSGGGGGTTITVKDDGSTISGSASALNFTGGGVAVTDGGGGQVDIEVAGAAGSWGEDSADLITDLFSPSEAGNYAVSNLATATNAPSGLSGRGNLLLLAGENSNNRSLILIPVADAASVYYHSYRASVWNPSGWRELSEGGGGGGGGTQGLGIAGWTVPGSIFTAENSSSPQENAVQADDSWLIEMNGSDGASFAGTTDGITGGADFDVVFAVGIRMLSDNYATVGVYVEDDGNDEKTCCAIDYQGNFIRQYWDGTTFQAEVSKMSHMLVGNLPASAPRMYWRIERVSGTLYFYFSVNGIDWTEIFDESVSSSGMTDVDRVGVYVNSNSVSSGVITSIRVWGYNSDGPQPEVVV